VATATRGACLQVGEAARALAGRADGTVIDAYGFPVGWPEDMLPVATAPAPQPGGTGGTTLARWWMREVGSA
jgi:hypothetical protein